MNWVDLLIILILMFFTLEGLGKPFIYDLFDFVSFLVSFSFALEFYSFFSVILAKQFKLPPLLANVLGFIVIWYLMEALFLLISRDLISKRHNLVRFKGDEFLSLIPSFLRGIIFITVVLIIIETFPIQPKIKDDINSSKVSYWLLSKSDQIRVPLKQIFSGLSSPRYGFIGTSQR